MPRFVLLYHDCPPDFGKPSHWDFMLEDEGVLLTWALAERPNSDAGCGSKIAATQLANHRLAYLNYEGPVSGDRGNAMRVDAGTYSWVERAPTLLRIRLAGEALSGEAVLTHIDGDTWNFSWLRDLRT